MCVFSDVFVFAISLFKLIVNVLSADVARDISSFKEVVNAVSTRVALVISFVISVGKLFALIDVITPNLFTTISEMLGLYVPAITPETGN